MWLERLEGSPPFVEAWLSHQRRDAYWKQGSVCEDYAAIECAVYAVGGWADGYRTRSSACSTGSGGPRKGLIGPWGHQYPGGRRPGPGDRLPAGGAALVGPLAQGHRHRHHGRADAASLDAGSRAARAPFYAERPGRWVAEPSWPSAADRAARRRAPLAVRRSREVAAPRPTRARRAAHGAAFGAPATPRPTSARGRALAQLHVGAARRAARDPRLPGGRTHARGRPAARARLRPALRRRPGRLLAPRHRGLLNLTHRDSHEHPAPLEPGRRYTVTVRLNAIAPRLPARSPPPRRGVAHLLADAWPSPEAVTLTVHGGGLDLPVRGARAEDGELAPFESPKRPRRSARACRAG